MCTMVWEFEHSSVLEWKLHFPVQWPLQSFPDMLTYWVQHLTASSFRILNCSAAIPSPPLAMFLVILPKAHLTSHSGMSGFRWVTTPSWLSGWLRPFLYSSSVYSCDLFLISSASVRSLPFLSFIVPILAWNVPLIFQILKDDAVNVLHLICQQIWKNQQWQ